MIRARGLVTTIALACLLAPLAISTETVAAGTTSTGSDDGSQTGHRDDPGHRTPPAQKAALAAVPERPRPVRNRAPAARPDPAERRTHRHRLRALPEAGPQPAEPRHDRRGRGRARIRDHRQPVLLPRPVRAADAAPAAAARRQPGHRHVGADPLPAAAVLPGQPQPGHRPLRPPARRDLRPLRVRVRRRRPRRRARPARDQPRRPVRRLLRHVLRPDLRRCVIRTG